MRFKNTLKDIGEYILSLFFPNRCIFCEKIVAPFEGVCKSCEETLPWINGDICHLCGHKESDCICKKHHGKFYDAIVSPLYYVDNVRTCIHNFKFKDERVFAKTLAKLMNNTRISEYSDVNFDYVTYIPMNRKHQKKRGYNQGRLLAKELSEISLIPFADELLLKVYETDTQHLCGNAVLRQGNLLGAFDVNPEFSVKGKKILLVDDVKTSGCTLNECSKMLYLNGADLIYCITASLVKNENKKKKKEDVECSEQK